MSVEGELLRAIALAWHDLGERHPVTRSIAAAGVRDYLGEVLAWAVQARQAERALEYPDFVPLSDLPSILRLLGWPEPSAVQEMAIEGDGRTLSEARREAETAALRARLMGE